MKTRECHIRSETEKEKEQLVKKWAKDNSPSPSSYRSIECHDKTSKYSSSKMYKCSKNPKSSFIEKHVNVKKNIPGVGKYNPEKSRDFAYCPVKKGRF